jgi:hypothetical protein
MNTLAFSERPVDLYPNNSSTIILPGRSRRIEASIGSFDLLSCGDVEMQVAQL